MTRVAWPVVVSMLSYTAMGVVDTLFVGRLGTPELAGTALAATATIMLCAFPLGTLRGVKVVVSQATGARQPALAVSAGWQGIWLSVVGGAMVAIVGLEAETVAAMLGGSAQVQGHAATYFAIRCLAAPAWFVMTAVGECFQGIGDTQTPMRYNLLANGMNIALTPLLVMGWGPIPAMGVAGAALATAVSFTLGATALTWRFRRRFGRPVPFEPTVCRRVLAVGVPVGMRWLVDVAGWSLMTAMLARVGQAEVAATQVAIRIVSVSFLPGHGVSEAASILVGQYVGARDEPAARRSFVSALRLACALMGGLGLVFLLAPEPIIRLFSQDPEVVERGRVLLLYAAVFQLFDAVAMTAMGALNGAGDTRFVMIISMAGSWLIMVPLGWYAGLHLGMGAAGVWLGVTVEIGVRAAVCWVRWSQGGWRDKAVVVAA